jgi:hypothetical protein
LPNVELLNYFKSNSIKIGDKKLVINI